MQVQFYPAILLEFTFRALHVLAHTLNSFTDGNVPFLDNSVHHLYAGFIVLLFTFVLSNFFDLSDFSFYHVALVLCAAFQMRKKKKSLKNLKTTMFDESNRKTKPYITDA